MKKYILLFVTLIAIYNICLAQVIPDSLKGIYTGLFYYKTSQDSTWASIDSATLYIYTIDSSNCLIWDNFVNNPPGLDDYFITSYNYCNNAPINPNYYHKFYDLDSVSMIANNGAQPPPATYTVTEHFYGKKVPGSSLTVGINNLNVYNRINIFPNPAIEDLTIEVQQKSTIDILNIQGQTIIQQTLPLGKTDIDISGLAKGVYILRLCLNDKTEVKRIVKE
jgi:hypothetical protein